MIQLCFSNISFVTNETFASKKPVCKKCKSKDLSKDIDGFPLCVHCGWVDYSKDIPKAKQPKAKHLRTASVLLKYIGVGKNLKEKLLQVYVKDSKGQHNEYNKIRYEANCPFCPGNNRIQATNRKVFIGRKNTFIRYLNCSNKHKIRFIETNEEGLLGWQ